MSDLVLRTTSKATVARYRAADKMHRLVSRLRSESGQDMIEYAGVLVIVALIVGGVAALFTNGGALASTITTAITKAVDTITGTKS